MADDHEAARTLLRELGATDDQLAEGGTSRGLHGFVSDLVLGRDHKLSADDVATRTSVDLDRVVGLWRTFGVTVDEPTAAMFSEEDLAITDVIINRGVFGDDRGEDVLRVVGASMARIAEAAVSAYVQIVEAELEASGAGSLEQVRRNLDAMELGIAVGQGLGSLFQHHLLEAIDRQRLSQEAIARRELARLAVGFGRSRVACVEPVIPRAMSSRRDARRGPGRLYDARRSSWSRRLLAGLS